MITVYFADTTPLYDENIYKKYYLTLSEERRRKADRMALAKDKALCIGAGILLDCGLLEYGLGEADMKYGTLECGKPCFANHPSIFFNISHSGTKVMVAFSDRDVGCDIEEITDIDMKLAERFFMKSEYDAVMSKATERERKETFFRFWTLKESFMKITGLGMKLPFDAFEIKPDGGEISVEQTVDGKEYFFREFDAFDSYKSALCTTEKNASPVCRFITIQ